ncbi:MAG: hypothetical protein R8G01_20605 [Ilumatobacteraceae bacterium]|nr:hypothetical protein [Ilumatobacteraceae bacterium]
MRLNDRVRRRLTDQLAPGETIEAAVGLANQIGASSASSDGSVRASTSSALGTPYARALGIDLTDPRHRSDLMSSWCTITDRRLLFHEPHPWNIRPTPGKLITELPRGGVTLHYFDVGGLGLSNRVIHLDFPDGTRLVSATMLKATLRKRNYTDEPDLFVEAFGDHAHLVDDG